MWIAMPLLVGVIFFAGAMYARNRIMHNMMSDLVEIEDMTRWLRIWT